MSYSHKLSLWQKLKRLLTSKSPQDIVESVSNSEETEGFDILTENIAKKTAVKPVSRITTENSPKATTQESTDNNTRKKRVKTAKVSLLKPGKDSSSKTPMIDCLRQYFEHKQWHYTHYKPRLSDSQQSHHLSLRMKNRKVDCGYLFRAQEAEALLAVYGILPFLIPESHQSAAILLITQINYDMIVGNLEMDVNDGEIRYKNAIDVEVVGLDEDIIEHLLQSVVAMTTVAHEVFSDLINTSDPSDDMPTLLGELRQQADARTFFLVSKKMQ